MAKATKEKHPRLLSVKSAKPSRDLYDDMLRQMSNAIDATYIYVEKFPRRQKLQLSLGGDIRSALNDALMDVIRLTSYNETIDDQRESLLRELSVKLKFANQLIDIAHRQHYISGKHFTNWAKLITTVDTTVIRLAMWYQNHPVGANNRKEQA